MDASQRLQYLFQKYLERRCTAEEVKELTTLLRQADAEEMLSVPMEELWKKISLDPPSPTVHEVDWAKMYQAVSQSELDIWILRREKVQKTRRLWYLSAAAVVLLLAAVAGYRAISPKASHSLAEMHPIAGDRQLPPKKQVIHLPDGSTVILNTNSKLEYPSTFASHTREVTLSGEAFFDIAHRTGQPFIVHTGALMTRVLGTTFNIRAYPSDDSVRITVTQGRVQVLKENRRMELSTMGLLTANQQISFNKLTEAYVHHEKVNVAPFIAWKPQELPFDDVTMEQAATLLEKRFHVAISFANPTIKGCRVTATFYEDDSLDEILTVICGVSQSSYTIQNNKITIDGKGFE